MAITQTQLQAKAASIAKTRISTKALKRKLSEKYAGVENVNTVAVIGNGLVSNAGTYSAATFTAEIGSAVDVVNVGRLASAVYAPASSQTGVGSARTSGTSAGATGTTISDVYLRADGTRQLEGNLSVVNGVTIDGIDISVHAANPDAHHTKLHNIVDPLHHSVTGAQLSVVGLYAIDTLGILPTTSRGDQNANTILRTGASKDLYVSVLDTPNITTQAGNDLTIQPATKKSVTYGAVISMDSVVSGSTGGAILQGVVDSDNSFSRAFIGHNARWDSGTNLWNIDPIGANDASGFLLRNNAAAIDVIFHQSVANVARTMTHSAFTAGAKVTFTSGGYIGANTSSPSYNFDTPGTLRAQTSVITPLITTTSGDLTIDPVGVVLFPQTQTIKTVNFNNAFPIAGFQINEKQVSGVGIGVSVLTIGEIQADSLAVKVFVADETRVDRGNQLWAKSFGILAADFTIPDAINGTATVTFEDSPALPGAIFSNGDWIMFQQIDRGTGLTIAYHWGTVSGYIPSSTADEQSWTYTHKVGSLSTVGSPIVLKKGRIAIDWGQTGQAVIALSTVDESGSPYLKLMRWSGVTGPYDTNTRKTLVAIGDLGSGVGNPYYSPTGDGIWIQPGLSTSRFLVADDTVFRIQGIDLRMFNGSNQTVDLSATNGSLKLGTNITSSTTTGFTFDGTTGNLTIGSASYASSVTVYGTINITGGNAAKNDFSNLTSSATLDQVYDGSLYKRTNANEKTGAGRAYSALSTTNNLVTSVIPATAIGNPGSPGLFLGSDYMGYHNGSGTAAGWKTYLDSSGNFRFQGSATNNYLQWTAASNKLQGVGGGIEQWYASAVDGKLYAAGGSIGLDSTGLWLLMNSATGWSTANAVTFRSSSNWNTVDAALLSRTVTTSRYVSLLIDPNTSPTGLEIIASPAAQRVNITHDLTVQGTLDAITGLTVNGTSVSLVGHNHNSQYLALSGGTLTGTLTSRDIVFAADNTYDIGTSTNRVQDLYVTNLHVNTVVGTPTYAHSHAASDITSGVLDFARIPTTWTGSLTLDADSAGTSNYVRLLTQTSTGKAWDLIGRAWDYATTSQQNDLLLTFYDGVTTYVIFQADSGTRVIDFGQTPTVGGTALSLSNHNHDSVYVPLTRTITAGGGMIGGGALSANITISHGDTSSVADVSNVNGNVLRSITFDTYGHVQTIASYDLDGRYYTETEINSLLTGYVPTSRIVNAGAGMTGGGALSSDITISHLDTSSQASVSNTGLNFIQSVTLDTYGHVTALTSGDIGSALDARYVNVTGDNMTGTLIVSGAPLISTTSGTTGGAIIQGIADVDNSFSRVWMGHNAEWDSVTNLWTMDAIGANDAAGFLVSNNSTSFALIFHPTTGNTQRTMDHTTFVAGEKFRFTNTGRLGVLNTTPSYEIDVTGSIRASTSTITPSITTASGILTITSAAAVVNISGAVIGSSSASFVGTVTAAADVDSNHTLGKAIVGYALTSDTASFSHYDQNTSTNYGFAQSSLGRSVVNAASGQTVDLSIANTPQWTVNTSGILPRGSAQVDIGDYNRLVRKLNAAELSVQTLVAKNVISTIGGDILVTPTTKLIADISSTAGGVGQSNLYTNVAAFWRLEESSGTRFDADGSNNLSDTGSVGSIAGKVGTAANFSGSNYLSVADNATLSVSDIDFYLSCWIYIGNDTGANRYILFKGASTSGSRSWALYLNGAVGAQRARFQVWNTGMGSNQTVTASGFGNLAINTWYFVEAWHNASSNLIGVAVNRTETTAAWSSGANDDTGPLSIGAAGATSNFTGYIDEIGFWKNYIPNTTERNALYNSGTGVTWSDIYRYGATDINLDVENNSLRIGEYVILKTAPGGIAQQEKMKITGGPSAISGGFRYTASRDLDVTNPNNWYAGDAVASQQKNVGEGYLWLTSTSTVYGHNGPSLLGYVRTGTNVDDVKPVFVKGNLRSLVDYATDEYGDAAGNDLTLSPTTGFKGYTIDRVNGLRLFNTEIKLYDSGVESVRVNSTVGIRLTTGTSLFNKLAWYNAIGGYDQGYIQGTLSSGTASVLLRAQAKDISTGAYSGNADITISNSVTASSIRLLANDGSVNGPNYHLTVANTGVAINSLGLSVSSLVGIVGINIITATNQTQPGVYLQPANCGSSYGPFISIDRNNNGSTPSAGWLRLVRRDGNSGDLWVDASGNLRIGVNSAVTNATDTSGGTVVGTQSSSLDTKNVVGEFTDYNHALQSILDAPLYNFTYKNGSYNGEKFTGIITDYSPMFGLDRDKTHPNGKSLDVITAHGYEMAAIKALHKKIEYLEQRVRELESV